MTVIITLEATLIIVSNATFGSQVTIVTIATYVNPNLAAFKRGTEAIYLSTFPAEVIQILQPFLNNFPMIAYIYIYMTYNPSDILFQY